MAKKNSRIADNPSLKELRESTQGLADLLKHRRLLRLLGAEVPEKLSTKAAELARRAKHETSLPDRFNDCFGDRGWIAYDTLNHGVMERAVELGESGELDAAEEVLVEHFDEKIIDFGIKLMFAHPAFHPRERLARLALEDYVAGRYHACVPVVLMLIDGFVNDVSRSKGFFAENTDLLAWDSVAAHDRGLRRLSELWREGRRKTTTDPLSMPYLRMFFTRACE